MANISYLHRRHHSHNNLHHHDPDDTHHMDPYFPHCSPSSTSNPQFDEEDDVVSDTESVILNNPDRDSQVSFVMDLFHQRVEQSHLVSDSLSDSAFGLIDESSEVAFDNADLDFGLGFGFDAPENCGFHNHETNNINGNSNIVLGDDDDFCVDGCVSRVESREAESTVGFCTGLRVVGFGSDSDSEGINENSLAIENEVDDDDYCLDRASFGNRNYDSHGGEEDDNASVTIPLFWDSLQLEDHREGNEDFEWVVDEREVINMFADDEEASVSLSISPIIAPEDMVSVERAGGLGNLEWEFLLNAHNLDSNPDQESDRNADTYFAEHDDYIYTGEYETLFGQFVENEIGLMGRPPAAKSVVEKLPSIVLTQEDVKSGSALCAVCKDDINVGERVNQLPCLHRYHGECIVPWLGIRNTCPVCRHELPTDDMEYERRKAAQRAVVSGHRL